MLGRSEMPRLVGASLRALQEPMQHGKMDLNGEQSPAMKNTPGQDRTGDLQRVRLTS